MCIFKREGSDCDAAERCCKRYIMVRGYAVYARVLMMKDDGSGGGGGEGSDSDREAAAIAAATAENE